jgi:DNA-binding transcriptional regulator GbsR (MarR family)
MTTAPPIPGSAASPDLAGVSAGHAGSPGAAVSGPAVRAETIRRELAEAWGEMGASWGVAPAIARVHIYLMARGVPLTEREVREALGLSHRAASLALDAAIRWGVVERVEEPRRVGRRGPAGTAYASVGDHFRWFSRVIEHRKALEGDPIIGVLERTAADATAASNDYPDDAELADLRDWLATFLWFVRLFNRAIGLVPVLEPTELERLLDLLARIPDETILGLVRLLGQVPAEDVLDLATGLSKLSPAAARRSLKLMAGVVRTVGR